MPKILKKASEVLDTNSKLKFILKSEIEEKLIVPEIVLKTQPLFNYNIIAYRLSEAQARLIYPKYKDESVNWDENKRLLMPDMPINLPYAEIIETNEFQSIVVQFLSNLRAGLKIYKGELVMTSKSGNLKQLDLKNNKIIIHLTKHQGETSIEGTKLFIDFHQNTLYTIIDSSAICAYELIKKD